MILGSFKGRKPGNFLDGPALVYGYQWIFITGVGPDGSLLPKTRENRGQATWENF